MMKLKPHAIFDRLQNVLLISFALIAVVTFVVQIWTTSAIVNNYMERAQNERVDRDMNLAVAFYERSMIQLNGAATRLASDPTLAQQIHAIQAGDRAVQSSLEQRMSDELTTIYPSATYFALVVDGDGNLVVANGLIDGRWQRMPATGN